MKILIMQFSSCYFLLLRSKFLTNSPIFMTLKAIKSYILRHIVPQIRLSLLQNGLNLALLNTNGLLT
jgi:hypothetical protein